MIGAEYTFPFQNMNVERGLLWNQETAVSRGIQINQVMGKFTASFSWNDGFYSNKYTWLSGAIADVNGPHALSFVAGGNLKETSYQTFATPIQNKGSIYNVIYTYTKGRWIINRISRYTSVPTNLKAGIVQGGVNRQRCASSRVSPSSTASRCLCAGNISQATEASPTGAVNLLYGLAARQRRSPSRPPFSPVASSSR